MLGHREAVVLLLILCFSMLGSARIPPKVIALKQVLYDELQAVQRGALITNFHASPDADAFGQLRRLFHEFERQNQESITAILRVLALVDHTLENTIKDCAKLFDLPSLESENMLFRDVTRPLLLRIAQLCDKISSEELTGLESIMEAVEEESDSYRKRLDSTKADMQTILEQLEKQPVVISMANKLGEPLDRMEIQNSSIRRVIAAATGKFLATQRSIRDSVLDAISQNSNGNEDVLRVIDFMAFLENETRLLETDLAEQLELWFNQTESTMYVIAEEVEAILHNLIESPITAFLDRETSLKCLAEYYKDFGMHTALVGLEDIFGCFAIDDDVEKRFQTVELLLRLVEDDVELIFQGVQNCYESARETDNIEMISCFEAVDPILDATEEFVEAKMNEIYFNVEDSLNFKELKTEACLYYKAREAMMDEAFMNLRYLRCNEGDGSTSKESFEREQFLPV